MSHSERSGTGQERDRSVLTSLFHSFPIWKMEPNNGICPIETGKTEGNSGRVLPIVSRRNYILINAHVRYISTTTATITTITILITGFSRHWSNSFKQYTHTNTSQESSRLVWFSFYRWGNWVPEIWNILVKSKQLLQGGAKIQPPLCLTSNSVLQWLLQANYFSMTDQHYLVRTPNYLGMDK